MNILILHHVEPLWNEALKKHSRLTFEEFEYLVFEYLEFNQFDKIILTRFEEWKIKNGEYNYIENLINQIHPYAYGWEEADLQKSNQLYCKGGNHSEVVLIENWMLELKGHNISIAGCFDGECLEDLEIALKYCGIEYNRIEELIR